MTIFRSLKSIILLICLVCSLPACAAAESIGMVLAVQGSVSAMREGASVPLAAKDPVSVRDTILTGPDSKIQILLNDESSITIGPDSSLELREFADAGENSKFNAHIGQGMMRIITGRVTEANPDGFKVTTPLAIVGIRGTLIVFDVTKDRTIIDFQNSSKTLIVNGATIPENNRITITIDSTNISVLPQQDKLANEAFAVNTGSGDSDISDDDTASSAITDTSNPLDNISLPTGSAVEDVIKNSSATTGLITGAHILTGVQVGAFSFNVDLSTGNVTNAMSSGVDTVNGTNSWNISGGTGVLTGIPGGFSTIRGFSGTANGANAGSNTYMIFSNDASSYQNVGDAVNGQMYLYDNTNTLINPLYNMEGTRVQ